MVDYLCGNPNDISPAADSLPPVSAAVRAEFHARGYQVIIALMTEFLGFSVVLRCMGFLSTLIDG